MKTNKTECKCHCHEPGFYHGSFCSKCSCKEKHLNGQICECFQKEQPEQNPRPRDCKNYTPRIAYFGEEKHDCFCGGTVNVCDNCGGDWHEDEKERVKCPKFTPPQLD